MDPNDNTVSPDSSSPNSSNTPNLSPDSNQPTPPANPNPPQTSVGVTPSQKQTPDPTPQSPFPIKTSPKIINRPSMSQATQKYPAFAKVDATPPSYVLKPQQASTPQNDNQAHYNTQQDAHVVQPTTTTQPLGSSRPKKSKKKLLAIFGLLLFLISIAGSVALAWGVAYNKVELKSYPKAELAIKQVVYSLPFTQKPPEYLMAKTIQAHQDVTRESFDVSLAIGSDELSDPLGISQLDFQIKGNVDYTDPKNVFFNTEIFLTKGLNLELRKKEKNVYFNIKDIPSFLLAFAGMSKSQFEPVLNKWVSWDTSPLDTEARRTIQDQESDYLSSEFSDELFTEYVDDYLLENLTVEDGEVDGHRVYKIALDADKEMIDYIQRKLEDSANDSGKFTVLGYTADSPKMSDFVKTLVAEVYIDKSSYYTRKVILSVQIEYDADEFSSLGLGMTGSSGTSKGTVAFAAKFDDFGEEVIVEEPATEMDSEEFIEKVSVIVSEVFGNMYSGTGDFSGSYSPMSNDSQRMSDMLLFTSALEAYQLDCGEYPENVNELLVGCPENPNGYLDLIPHDPTLTPYYYQSDGNTYDLCLNFDSTVSVTTPCPDSSYNYRISSNDL